MIVNMVFSVQKIFDLFDGRNHFELPPGKGELHAVRFYTWINMRAVSTDSVLGANWAAKRHRDTVVSANRKGMDAEGSCLHARVHPGVCVVASHEASLLGWQSH
jgi:hypothetical protein